MHTLQAGVYAFHKKHGFPVDHLVVEPDWRVQQMLKFTRWVLRALSKMLLKFALKDLPDREETYRLHLIIEETEELAEGLQLGDEEKAADGLGDLLYVAVGTGVVYRLPCDTITEEIQASNMSKAPRKKDNPRLRDKGPDYFKPNIRKAIEKGRLNDADYRGK